MPASDYRDDRALHRYYRSSRSTGSSWYVAAAKDHNGNSKTIPIFVGLPVYISVYLHI